MEIKIPIVIYLILGVLVTLSWQATDYARKARDYTKQTAEYSKTLVCYEFNKDNESITAITDCIADN